MTVPFDTHEELEQLKGTFLASLNHEIRTPLAGVMGMVDLLLETTLDEEQREYVNAARLCAENLFEMLNATLEFAALEGGQFTLDVSEFSLREMLEAALAQQRAKAEAKDLRLTLTVDPALTETMVGDAPRLRELLGHLIANAIKFTPSGSVDVSARLGIPPPGTLQSKGWLIMEVHDTGIGIPSGQIAAIFDSFRQGNSGLSRAYPGLGLGLALARKLATVMGGDIVVESLPGLGSRFTAQVPFERPGVDKLERGASAAGPQTGPLILAVDDNQVGLTILRHALQRNGLRVDCATSAREALEAATLRHYDLILMDLQMPEMDGLTAAVEMRRVPGYERVPIVALTATTSDELREQCRLHGMQAFLSKPVEAGELLAAVSRHLQH